MNTKIDIKSALIGIALGVLGMLVIGATGPTGPVGRYQLGGTSNQGLVLDTATGEVWAMFFSSGGGKADPDFFLPKNKEKK